MEPGGRDQAETLRALRNDSTRPSALESPTPQRPTSVLAVASGKGGVGKTNLVANLAIALSRVGHRVLAIDGDLGMANLDLAFGISPSRTFLDIFQNSATIEDILTPATNGVCVLPACSGRYDLANLSSQDRYTMFDAIDSLEDRFDTLLIDTGAGIGTNAVAFAGAAQDIILVANTEPTSQADAYAFIKVVTAKTDVSRIHIVANMVNNSAEGELVFGRLATLADRFLGIRIQYMGAILRDPAVPRAIHAGVPILLHAPNAAASRCMVQIARKIDKESNRRKASQAGGIQLFWKRLLVDPAEGAIA